MGGVCKEELLLNAQCEERTAVAAGDRLGLVHWLFVFGAADWFKVHSLSQAWEGPNRTGPMLLRCQHQKKQP